MTEIKADTSLYTDTVEKPRELLAVYDETGARRAIYDDLDSKDLLRPPGWDVVRFVEQP
ncbi:MAG: hypothetical protein V4636_05450 [Pseudomonadota bacterium]